MTDEKKTPKIVFAPGAFDNFDGTQEELDEMVAEIQKMFDGKTAEEIMAEATPITNEDFDELPIEVQEQLARSLLSDHDEDLADEFKRRLQ